MKEHPTTLESLNARFVPATVEDAEMLVEYENTPGVTHPETYRPLRSRDEAIEELRDNTYFFIKQGENIIGTAAFRPEPTGGTYIPNLTVAPPFRGKGMASAAIQRIIDMNPDSEVFMLHAHPKNTAQALYKELGFEDKGLEKPPFPTEGDIDYVKMVKRVIPVV